MKLVSPRNAASHFGASIESALQGVEVRVKRLEGQSGSGVAQLEEALRGAEARIHRLERDRDGQARLYERVESLVASRVGDLRESVNRSLEVIVDKVRGEVGTFRADLSSKDAQLRQDLGLELDSLRELRHLAGMEARLQAEMQATKDICMAATLQVGSVEDALGRVRSSVAALPSFLWSLEMGDSSHRRFDVGAAPDPRPHAGGHAQHRSASSGGLGLLARAALVSGAAAAEANWAPAASPRALQRPRGTDGPSPQEHGEGWAAGGGERPASAETRRRKKAEREANREALEAGLAITPSDRHWAASVAGGHSASRRSNGPLSMSNIAGEALLDVGRGAD